MRSTIHGSKGNVTVPEPMKNCAPSYSCITEPTPANPRALRPLPPLPGDACDVTPAARLLASEMVASPRSRTTSPGMIWTLAGVSSSVMPRRLPVNVGCSSVAGRLAVTLTPSAMPATCNVIAIGLMPAATAIDCRDPAKPAASDCSTSAPGATASKVKTPSALVRTVRVARCPLRASRSRRPRLHAEHP